MSISKSSIEIIFGRAQFHLRSYEACFRLSKRRVPHELEATLNHCEFMLTKFECDKDEDSESSESLVESVSIMLVRRSEEKYLKWMDRGAMSFYPFTGMEFGGYKIISKRLNLTVGLN